jgi:hypothetical protein
MRFRILLLSVFMSVSLLLLIGGERIFSTELNGEKTEMKTLLPLEIGSYKSDGKDGFYDRQTTFRYMDGAAEMYRRFAFKLLMVRRYVKGDHPPIVLDLTQEPIQYIIRS